jgi:hypothetical protein
MYHVITTTSKRILHWINNSNANKNEKQKNTTLSEHFKNPIEK